MVNNRQQHHISVINRNNHLTWTKQPEQSAAEINKHQENSELTESHLILFKTATHDEHQNISTIERNEIEQSTVTLNCHQR